jgi:hypothetical protein
MASPSPAAITVLFANKPHKMTKMIAIWALNKREIVWPFMIFAALSIEFLLIFLLP